MAKPTWKSTQLGEAYRGKKPASWKGLPFVGTIGAMKKMRAKATTLATAILRLVKLSREGAGHYLQFRL